MLTVIVTLNVAPWATGLDGNDRTAVRDGAFWMLTDAVAADGVVTVELLFASVPLAVALRESVPIVVDEQFVYWNGVVAPPEIDCDAGVPLHAEIAAGATPFAVAVPVFFTVRVSEKACPLSALVVTGAFGTSDTACRAAAVCASTETVVEVW
ncbi:MAG TPA: hypothetical protein VMT17_11170 [Anaeromyxobacteraceae bacterium]|nr:hypothetical protein [Anaeromyxobacteraceae bacterium]